MQSFFCFMFTKNVSKASNYYRENVLLICSACSAALPIKLMTFICIAKRKGSVICDTEIVVVENFEDNITRVLDNIQKTGQLGNFSTESLTFMVIAGNFNILVYL